MKVLIAEDDRKRSQFLTRAFAEEGYAVDHSVPAPRPSNKPAKFPTDLVVLDWMLPEQDGLSVCRDLRRGGNQVPALKSPISRIPSGKPATTDGKTHSFYRSPPSRPNARSIAARAVARCCSACTIGLLRCVAAT